MPAFFALSGYFSAMLLETRGAKAFLWNRCQRLFYRFVFVPTGLTLSILHIRAIIFFIESIAALGSLARTTLMLWLGNLNHLWFVASYFDNRSFLVSLAMISKIFDLTGAKGRGEFRTSAWTLRSVGSEDFLRLFALLGFASTDTDWVPQHDLILIWVLPDWLNRVSIED